MRHYKRYFNNIVSLIFITLSIVFNDGCSQDKNKLNLPDPLICKDGTKVTNPEIWFNKRRAEVLSLFEENVYGRTPGVADSISSVLVKENPNFINGKAIMQQITLQYINQGKALICICYW